MIGFKYGKTLEKVNCQVVNVNGVAFSNFLRVIQNGYFIKTAVLTDSDTGKKTQNRAINLKTEYNSESIMISITTLSTFEKEIFEVNKTKKANRNFLLDILQVIRPNKCNENFYSQHQTSTDFNVDELFNCVEAYKSEFAFELSSKLEEKMKSQTKGCKNVFQIPEYIETAFKFINGE